MKPGKRTKAWLKFRREYLKGKKNHQGYYEADCGHWTEYPHLHHVELRGSHPERLLDPTNIKMLCGDCHKDRHP